MKVYKFGGASVKDAAAVKNVYEIIRRESDRLVVVVYLHQHAGNTGESLLRERPGDVGHLRGI